MDKVLFTKEVVLIPKRRGIYKDIVQDTIGFHLLVENDKAGVGKASRPSRRRRWGEDPEYDDVMRNFGMSEGREGEHIEQQLVFGFANVTVQEDGSLPVDWQGDVIETSHLESAAYNFVMSHGLANQEHESSTECGWLVESMMFTKEKMDALGIPEGTVPEGWFVGFYIPDPDVYQKVKNGEFNMFSIEGSGRRIPMDVVGQDENY